MDDNRKNRDELVSRLKEHASNQNEVLKMKREALREALHMCYLVSPPKAVSQSETESSNDECNIEFANEREKIAYFIKTGKALYLTKKGIITTDKKEGTICIPPGKMA